MTQQALVRGEVCFRVGDGVLVPIPPGAIGIDMADDSVTLSWDGDGAPMSTAITRDEYERYVADGRIRVE